MQYLIIVFFSFMVYVIMNLIGVNFGIECLNFTMIASLLIMLGLGEIFKKRN